MTERRHPNSAISMPDNQINLDCAADFVERLKQSFEQGDGCDLTITCNGRKWKVHKLVLCLHSKVFDRVLRGPEKGRSEVELALDDDRPDVLDAVFKSMHAFELPTHMQSSHSSGSSTLQFDMHIAKFAGYYGIRYLKYAALESFRNTCEHASMDQEVVDTIEEAYAHDDLEEFREMLVCLAAKNLRALKAEPEKHASFWTVTRTCGKFSAALLQFPVAKRRQPRSRCSAVA